MLFEKAASFLTTVIFQQVTSRNPPIFYDFAITLGEMYPVGLCTHILPDVLWHVIAGSWRNL